MDEPYKNPSRTRRDALWSLIKIRNTFDVPAIPCMTWAPTPILAAYFETHLRPPNKHKPMIYDTRSRLSFIESLIVQGFDMCRNIIHEASVASTRTISLGTFQLYLLEKRIDYRGLTQCVIRRFGCTCS